MILSSILLASYFFFCLLKFFSPSHLKVSVLMSSWIIFKTLTYPTLDCFSRSLPQLRATALISLCQRPGSSLFFSCHIQSVHFLLVQLFVLGFYFFSSLGLQKNRAENTESFHINSSSIPFSYLSLPPDKTINFAFALPTHSLLIYIYLHQYCILLLCVFKLHKWYPYYVYFPTNYLFPSTLDFGNVSCWCTEI